MSHQLCWRNQTQPDSDIMCCNVKWYYKRGSRLPDYNVVFSRSPKQKLSAAEASTKKLESVEKQLFCSVCNEFLDIRDGDVKDHLKFSCKGISSTPIKKGYSRLQLSKRMAALGAKKKITPSQNTLSSSRPTTLEPGHSANAAGGF